MHPLLQTTSGAILILVALLDVFLTVLYARAGSGVISPFVTTGVWVLFRRLARPFGRRAGLVLSICGPAVVISLVFFWVFLLTVGAALIFHPYLGSAVVTQSGRTPTNFIAALFAAGNSMSIVGSGDFVPRTSAFRLLFLFDSLVGMSVISLTVTYLMQIYSALQRRNALGLQFHLLSGMTNDSAEMILRIAPEGRFDIAHSTLSDLGAHLADVKETHHFYPVLLYFRFPQAHYAMSYSAGMALDCASLIESALDPNHCRWLQDSGAVSQLWDASLLVVGMIEGAHGAWRRPAEAPSLSDRESWSRRYREVLERFRRAGIATPPDIEAGAQTYIQLRAEWNGRIQALADSMLYRAEEVDPSHRETREAVEPQSFMGRLHRASAPR